MQMTNKALGVALSLTLAGCAAGGGPLKVYPDKGERVGQGIIADALANGATSCRYNLEDVVIHAIGDRNSDGVAIYPKGDAARRPFSGLYVTEYPNGDRSNLQFSVGPDASGFCSVSWTETRYWRHSCEKVVSQHEGYEELSRSNVGASVLLSDGGTLQVLLTDASGSGCLVTESDMAWRIDPDEAARAWIKADHGYDPAIVESE